MTARDEQFRVEVWQKKVAHRLGNPWQLPSLFDLEKPIPLGKLATCSVCED